MIINHNKMLIWGQHKCIFSLFPRSTCLSKFNIFLPSIVR